MKRLSCLECGHVFDQHAAAQVTAYDGPEEAFGVRTSTTRQVIACPRCLCTESLEDVLDTIIDIARSAAQVVVK